MGALSTRPRGIAAAAATRADAQQRTVAAVAARPRGTAAAVATTARVATQRSTVAATVAAAATAEERRGSGGGGRLWVLSHETMAMQYYQNKHKCTMGD